VSPTVRLLRELVALPSVNPAFLPAGDARTGEQRVASFVLATARGAGLDATLQPVWKGRPNVIARLRPTGAVKHRVILAPHLDTVGEPNLDALLRPRMANGRLHGRGACDTKGCVAAMLTAVMNLARRGPRPAGTEVVFLGLVDEENGQGGSRHFVKHGLPADLAIVGEPTRLEVVTAHKGDLWLQLSTHGRSAHGSTPHLGRNAVHAMARVVEVLETEYAAQLKRRSHPLLGSPTVNVGSIRGGTQPNIVPDVCAISVDRRTIPGETDAQVRREIRALLRRNQLRARFDDLRSAPCLPMETDSKLPWVRSLLAASGRRRTLGVHYFCDAAVLGAGGIPSVVFGPGDIAQAHTSDEWIAEQSLEQGVQVLERFLRSLP
jgi:acetylornithine deacetylase/succinyl-diaminopimelate desuccinylase-like protein